MKRQKHQSRLTSEIDPKRARTGSKQKKQSSSSSSSRSSSNNNNHNDSKTDDSSTHKNTNHFISRPGPADDRT